MRALESLTRPLGFLVVQETQWDQRYGDGRARGYQDAVERVKKGEFDREFEEFRPVRATPTTAAQVQGDFAYRSDPQARDQAIPTERVSRPYFERFSERARQVVVLAQDTARMLRHNYIGTEHLLHGLLREEHGIAARVLTEAGLTGERVHERISSIVGEGNKALPGQLPFTPRTKRVLESALREALSMGHNYIGTEHILLALSRETEGVAIRILEEFELSGEKIRHEIVRILSGPGRRKT